MLKAYLDKNKIEAGCDEAGRGCLAGPVVAAAVILPKGYKNKLLDDSKKLSEKQRDELRVMIEKDAEAFAVAYYTNEQIDEVNILKASFLSMHKALDQLKLIPEQLLIDGNRFIPYQNIPHHCIIKGDAKFMSIAAASILAKTYRDEMMQELHQQFPVYNWQKNKGYPTLDHRKAIREHGPCKFHRMSFTLLPSQLSMFDE
jgi:ribonuclease HII